MRSTDFDYELPRERIAQAPLPRRDDARLLVLDESGTRHAGVRELPSLLPAGALLVVNDTRVIPARLYARKPTGGRVELLLVAPAAQDTWLALGGASKPIRPGTLALEAGGTCEVLAVAGDKVTVRFAEAVEPLLARAGEVPLPPYIERAPDPADRERYQTIFARAPGAVAAPTAGLHFTPELIGALEAAGIGRAAITLHVGPGTFAPLRSDDLDQARLHPEAYEVSEAAARAIAAARAAGRPVVAVGTTVVRTLESAADETGRVRAGRGETCLFVKPGHRFRAVDALLTNFHLPRSSLFMLVCAFTGTSRVRAAYQEAIAREYRFYSYGDAMLCLTREP